jgi:hypothetical protein
MLSLRSEKVLIALTVIFFVLTWIFKGWILFGLTVLCCFLGFCITIVSIYLDRRIKGSIAFCPFCKKLLLFTSANLAPEYGPGPGHAEIQKNDMLDFVKEHSMHQIDYLEVIFGPWHKGPIGDPMTPSFFVARFKRKLFFIKRSRQSIMEPMSYELLEKGLPAFNWRWRFARLAFK